MSAATETDSEAGSRESTRERIVVAAAELFRRQGYSGTGVKQILAEAEATFGSLYHHFPGGKSELGAEVVRRAGPYFAALVGAEVEAAPEDPAELISAFFEAAARNLEASGYADACPIATIALEVASTDEELRLETASVFEGWAAGLGAYLATLGIPEPDADELGLLVLAQLEGAFVLARAGRSTEPLLAAGRRLSGLVGAAARS